MKVDKIVFATILLIFVMFTSSVYENIVSPPSTCGIALDEEEKKEIVLRDVPYITINYGSNPISFSYNVALDEYIARRVYQTSTIVTNFWVCFLIIQPILLDVKRVIRKEDAIQKNFKKIAKRNLVLVIVLFFLMNFLNILNTPMAAKPVIYIYPETETAVRVSVGYPEKLSCVYPEYDDGWEVIAKPNGELVDIKTGRNLYCLYWEGNNKLEYKFKDGFVVAGEDSTKFLEEKLAILGLNEREANEFIIYWLPKLEANKYNLIRFETMEEIEEYMPLNIEPRPDTLIRISMNFKGLNRPVEIEEQKLETPIREGYTVVEWGGTEF